MALQAPLQQLTFRAGMCRLAQPLIPSDAAYKLDNVLVDDDGSLYRRGGTQMLSNANFGSSGIITMFDGSMHGLQRTVMASPTAIGALADDLHTPVTVRSGLTLTHQFKPVVMNGLLFIGPYAYGGALRTGTYSTGTLTVTNGSTTVVGSGTSWAANVDTGQILVVTGSQRVVRIAAVTDNTHLELNEPWPGTSGAFGYSITSVADLPIPYQPGAAYAMVGNRLLAGIGNAIFASEINDSSTWVNSDGVVSELTLPDGVQIIAIEPLGDNAIVFTSAGVWAIGNIALDLVDSVGNPQWSLQRFGRELIALAPAAISSWQGALVVPALDGVWLLQPDGSSTNISRTLSPFWAEFATLGYRPGQAAAIGSLFVLPIVDGPGTTVVYTLVCRLDRPASTYLGNGSPITAWPWTTFSWSAAGGGQAAYTVRVLSDGSSVTATLLGGERKSTGRVVSFQPLGDSSPFFGSVDHDGTHAPVEIITRDVPTDRRMLTKNLVKFVRLFYEYVTTGGGLLDGYIEDETAKPSTVWLQLVNNGLSAAGTDHAPASTIDGRRVFRWRCGRQRQYLRLRFLFTGQSSSLTVRGFDATIRSSGRM